MREQFHGILFPGPRPGDYERLRERLAGGVAPNETPPSNAKFEVAGMFFCRLLDPDGSVVDEWRVPNGAVTVGLNYLLDAGFRAQSQLGSWYIGLINDSSFTGLSASDTMSSHSGWVEATGYSNATREQWSPGAASGGVLINASAISFTINATFNVKGMFLTSNSTKSGTTGTLWATAVETSARSVTSGQTFQVYYQLTLTPVS